MTFDLALANCKCSSEVKDKEFPKQQGAWLALSVVQGANRLEVAAEGITKWFDCNCAL